MPHIAITMFPGRDEQTKQKLARAMQKALCEELGIGTKIASVSVEDIPMNEWEDSMKKVPQEAMFIHLGE
ncbi:Tautomerase enzyme [Parabacteroides sp. 52]|uniref:tautomerase family protein n=1 Tax=unclassified Parabacteroides TaxID=2649774 RepID=UPI0013D002AB|nr:MULTISPECIES: tautomerase family protein [unclassified Parabacteroides]MDH6534567.1 4-oxalocrotonate tautomerase [Parabacteroides sp. PM5-20]NDV55198.1 Tautomerase enzyme [Parabacteroides sp. 52]